MASEQHDHENQRLTLQATLDAVKSLAERNRLGQFATPTDLAVDILAYAKKLLPAGEPVRFLDPAFGTGSFYSALLRTFPPSRIAAAEGFEIDPHYGHPATELWHDTPLKLHLADFTRATPPATEPERFNLVICNPPYVRHHHIANGEKSRLRRLAERVCGVRLTGLSGLYCHFLGLSHGWMTENGIAGWLIPGEFMVVNYGRPVKQYLLNQVTLLRIHRFDSHKVQFDDALVSSAVVWFRKAKPPTDHQVECTFGGTLTTPRISKRVPASVLREEPKWTRLSLTQTPEPTAGITLGDIFTIKRGIATGDNRFFVLTRERIERHGLPLECFQPVLPSPRHLPVNEVLADEHGHPLSEPSLFLLDCDLPEAVIKDRYPALWRYLEEGKARGVHERYLCRHRSPWYAQEVRSPAPFLCTYMGRGNARDKRPFRFILNHSRATATNVYLLMYPRPALARELRAKPDLTVEVWQALDRIRPTAMLREGRVYGGGLHKLEPRELGNVPADTITALLPEMVARRARQLDFFAIT